MLLPRPLSFDEVIDLFKTPTDPLRFRLSPEGFKGAVLQHQGATALYGPYDPMSNTTFDSKNNIIQFSRSVRSIDQWEQQFATKRLPEEMSAAFSFDDSATHSLSETREIIVKLLSGVS